MSKSQKCKTKSIIKLLKGSQHKIKTSDYMKQNIKPSKTHYMYDTMLNKELLIKRNEEYK